MAEAWFDNFAGAITVCDVEGIILYMNERSKKVFEKDGGSDLIGKNDLDCHPEPARGKLKDMLKTQATNCYTIEKKGVKKLIHQTPWYKKTGEYEGFVELSIEIPSEMPHFVRK